MTPGVLPLATLARPRASSAEMRRRLFHKTEQNKGYLRHQEQIDVRMFNGHEFINPYQFRLRAICGSKVPE